MTVTSKKYFAVKRIILDCDNMKKGEVLECIISDDYYREFIERITVYNNKNAGKGMMYMEKANYDALKVVFVG